MVLQRIIGRTEDPQVRAERYKLLAGGCQLIAIGIFIAAMIAPFFNQSLNPPLPTRFLGGLAAAVIELLALRLLGYISSP